VILAALKWALQIFTFLNNLNQIFKIFRKTAFTKAMFFAALVKHIQQLKPFESMLAHRTAQLLAELGRVHFLKHQSWWVSAWIFLFYSVSRSTLLPIITWRVVHLVSEL